MRYNNIQDLIAVAKQLGYSEQDSTKLVDSALQDLYKKGNSIRKIERIMGFSFDAVRKHLLSNNVEMRKREGPNNLNGLGGIKQKRKEK